MKEKLRDGWLTLVVSAIFSLLVVLISGFITERRNKVEGAAPMEYVDKKDKEINERIDEHNVYTQKQLDMKLDESEFNQFLQRFEKMDDRIFELWKEMKTNENN